jgi:hypothetical protein
MADAASMQAIVPSLVTRESISFPFLPVVTFLRRETALRKSFCKAVGNVNNTVPLYFQENKTIWNY